MTTTEQPSPGDRVIVHAAGGSGTKEGIIVRMMDADLWVSFEQGANEPWDPSRMHRVDDKAYCTACG